MPDLEAILADLEQEQRRRESAFPIAIYQNRMTETEADRRNTLLCAAIERLQSDLDQSPKKPPRQFGKPSQRQARPLARHFGDLAPWQQPSRHEARY